MKAEIARELAAQERAIENGKKAFHGMARKLPGIVLAIAIGLMAFVAALPTPAWTQDKAADNMQILEFCSGVA